MRRREFSITLVGGAAAGWPLVVRAQQPERVRRIGVLMAFAGPTAHAYATAFRGALAKLGWAEGGNLEIELRWSAGDAERIRILAKELIDLRPDVIVGQSTPGSCRSCSRDEDNPNRIRKRSRPNRQRPCNICEDRKNFCLKAT